MFQRLASECFESVHRNAKASSDELQQASSSLVVELCHCLPEPLDDRRRGAACLETSVPTPVVDVDLTDTAHDNLSDTHTDETPLSKLDLEHYVPFYKPK